jgi:SPP1 gp7 family putative phage head morphogenesis protein
MDGILNRYSKQLLLNLEEFARHEARFSSGALDAATTFDAVIPSITQIRAAILATPLGVKGSGRGALLKSFIENWTQTEVRGVNGAIRRGVFEGKTNQSIISELRGSHARNYQDGLLNVTSRHAEAVVRTAVQHVATVARLESFAANADIIKAYQWLATLDKRTCIICASLDGRQFPPDKGPRPPIHISDRCTMVPVLKDEYAFLDEGATRASKGAEGGQQVSADLSYYDWLKEQPLEFIATAIGLSRAKLLMDGGLSADRFAKLQLDKKFSPLTLEEMKKLEPLAFKRAGVLE